MTTNKNIGLIECNGSGTNELSMHLNGYRLKKFMAKNKQVNFDVQNKYPDAESVDSIESMITDPEIDLILVSKPSQQDLSYVGEAIQSGKNVRIL
jgi:predicted dehydrogenase